MSTYQGDERRDQSQLGKDVRGLLGDIEKYRVITRDDFAVLAAEICRAWRLGFERGRAEGMRNAMDAVDRELGAMKEGV